MDIEEFAELWEEALEVEEEITFEPDGVMIKLLREGSEDHGS